VAQFGFSVSSENLLFVAKAGSPSRTRTSDPMINSHAPWVNRVKLQQIRITIQSP